MSRNYNDDRNRDRWREDDRERSSWRSGSRDMRDREDERGFFERAGDEVRSWFRDDDDDRRDDDFARSRSSIDRDDDFNRGSRSSWERDQYRGSSPVPYRSRSFDRDDSGGLGGMAQGGYGRSSSSFGQERDRASGSRDENGLRGNRGNQPQGWSDSNRSRGNWDQGMSNLGYGESNLGYGEFSGTLGGFGNQRFGSSQDDHYRTWRDRQIAELDRDYDEYCREREHQFNQDFDSWRRSRQGSALTSSASSSDLGAAANAGVGTTTSSITGTAGAGSAGSSGGSVIGGSSPNSSSEGDATSQTATADTGTGSGGRGSRSRS